MRKKSPRTVLWFFAVVFFGLGFAASPASAQKGDSAEDVCYCGGPDTASVSSAGRQFLLCFEQNWHPQRSQGDQGYLDMYIAALDKPATITITCNRYPKMNKVINLAARGSIVYRVNEDIIDYGGGLHDTLQDLWMNSDEQKDQRVVQVNSTENIVCYGMNNIQFTADAFLALPKSSGMTDYRILSYPTSIQGGAFDPENMPSQFAVAAYVDSTHITITPASATMGGHAAGAPFNITLNKGEGYQVQTNPDIEGLDLTGSVVTSDQPLAVFGSNARTEIPSGYLHIDGSGTSRDMLIEQMPPTATWGRVFVLSAVDYDATHKDPSGDLIRVLALNDNTSITVNGNPWTTIGRNKFADTLIMDGAIFEASGPVLVGEYEHTTWATNSPGDPFLAVVPSVDQTFDDFTFFVSSDPAYSTQKVIIAADTTCTSNIQIDGTLIPKSFFKVLPAASSGKVYAITEYPLQAGGAHRINTNSSKAQGFTILSYGVGSVISYGYTSGMLLKPLRTVFIKDPPPVVTIEGPHTNKLDFFNTANDPAYIDSAVFTPNDPQNAVFDIHPKEHVPFDIGRLVMGESSAIHLIPSQPLTAPVDGMFRIYSHTPNWRNIEPSEMAFTLYPDALANVANPNQTQISVSSYPNPFSQFTTISFSLPASGDVALTLYDEVGRVVQTIASGEFAAGPYAIRLERRALATGFYTCELRSQKLNIRQRVAIVAGE